MFERFTDGARRVVVLAQEEARVRGAASISADHLLLGILDLVDFDAKVPEALSCLEGSIHDLAADVDAVAASGPQKPEGHIPFEQLTKEVMIAAMREAKGRGDGHIGCEHLLLGIADGRSAGAAAMARRGATRDAIAATLGGPSGPGFTVKTTKGSGRFRRGSKGGA